MNRFDLIQQNNIGVIGYSYNRFFIIRIINNTYKLKLILLKQIKRKNKEK